MQQAQKTKINVTVVFAGFSTDRYRRKINPLRFVLPDGEIHEIASVKRSYADRIGEETHVHFVVRTATQRYFDIVYESRTMNWFLVVEIDETLLLG
jgi:hypothetical protein